MVVCSTEKCGLPPKDDLGRLGIFGGTFDPVHYGHLICADQLHEALRLDIVVFIPCSKPPHKPDASTASSEHRMSMIRLATEDRVEFTASGIEIARGGISYTVDTVRQIREIYGAGVELWLLMGMDSYLDIPTWKEPKVIESECFFGVACRPGYKPPQASGLPTQRTRFVDITSVDISSSGVRERLRLGNSVRYLVPDAVSDYIDRHKPYESL